MVTGYSMREEASTTWLPPIPRPSRFGVRGATLRTRHWGARGSIDGIGATLRIVCLRGAAGFV